MKHLKDYSIPEWIFDKLGEEVKRVFKQRAVLPVKGKTNVEITDAKSLANDVFDAGDGFYSDKDYDKKTELDIYPLFMADGYEAAYEIDLIKKKIKHISVSDDNHFNLKFLKKNLSNKKKFLIFHIYSNHGNITYIDKL